MFDNKIQENAGIFICEKCNFKSSKNSNYNKHLLTTKHKMFEIAGQNAGQKEQKNALPYKCSCGKQYKHNQ